ncbi:hypothetical protein JOC75_001151 [Metabacillus crassostreae]|uniref:hypothetical protein n=1 Tax=Metabacillus crassostreae TaxID=929098 RepID=UPI0019593EE4|nr:hypothetical protein [Metabacillus crassostreae]MBM7603181.1 hypothetical protein [Metabacillus crassostreae]
MSNSKEERNTGLIKGVAKEANDFVHNTVDTSGKIVKSVSGEGGLVGKTVDSSGRIVKKISDTGNNVIGQTVDSSSRVFKNVTDKAFKKKK